MKIGFLGAGNMACAIIDGLLKKEKITNKNVFISDISAEATEKCIKKFGVTACGSSLEVVENCEVIFLAVKPNNFTDLLTPLDGTLKAKNPLLISIAAGTTLQYISSLLSYEPLLARVMPNTNALAGESMTAICASEKLSEGQLKLVKELCAAFGKAVLLDEKYFSAFVALASSSPAFVYMFIDQLARAGVKLGIGKKLALEIAVQAVLGSAKLVEESGVHPYELIDRVCSPGGTTIEGIAALQKNGFESAVMNAVEASYLKDKKLSEG